MSEPVDCSQWGDLESGEEELAEEEEQQPALTDGMQTPSGLETPSGMGSVVSSVAAGRKKYSVHVVSHCLLENQRRTF